MTGTYAVVWLNGDPDRRVGRLAVDGQGLRLDGAAPGGVRDVRRIVSEDVRSAALLRAPERRLDGGPTLELALGNGEMLQIASLDGPGTLPEIVHHLALLGIDTRS